MRGVIKGLLAEELDNSLKMKRAYESELQKMPLGCLVRKNINGHDYYYLAQRQGEKVVYSYKGKVSAEDVHKYQNIKKQRMKYRHLLSQVKKQIKFLRGVLRGKEPV